MSFANKKLVGRAVSLATEQGARKRINDTRFVDRKGGIILEESK